MAQREALTGEQQQKLDQIRREHVEQDAILDEIASGLDELKDIATTINDVRTRAARCMGATFLPCA